MQKERLMAIFIGVTMILSVAGFSLSRTRFTSPDQKMDIPYFIDKRLTNNEIVSILRSGRVVIEDLYEANCTSCQAKTEFMKSFLERFKDFVVLEAVEANETSIKMIGSGGRIKDITDMELNQTSMMDVFCDMAIAQPKECLLQTI